MSILIVKFTVNLQFRILEGYTYANCTLVLGAIAKVIQTGGRRHFAVNRVCIRPFVRPANGNFTRKLIGAVAEVIP